jgi:hypothetical protein
MIKPTEGMWTPVHSSGVINIVAGNKTIAVIQGDSDEDWENAKAICTAKAALSIVEESKKLVNTWGIV